MVSAGFYLASTLLIIRIVGLNFYQGPYDLPSILMIHMGLSLLPHPVEIVPPPPVLLLTFLQSVNIEIVLLPMIREPKRCRIPVPVNQIIGASQQSLGFQPTWQIIPISEVELLKFFSLFFLERLLPLVSSRP